jgi:hypothetical protein
LSSDAALIAAIDERLKEWNQGDVVLGDAIPFVHLADLNKPISEGSREASKLEPSGDPLGVVVQKMAGAVVLTQSCDLVRSCRDQPFVKCAALQEVDAAFLDSTRMGQRPRFAYIPGAADRLLVGNLDAVTTVEKSILAAIEPNLRIRGCRTDREVSELAVALARNLGRFAFPDDFSLAVRPVRSGIIKKYGKSTNEGRLLASMREIRVMCSPSWTADKRSLTFYFIVVDRNGLPDDADVIVESLLAKFKGGGSFSEITFRLVSLNEMSAEAYVASEALDLEHLSLGGRDN